MPNVYAECWKPLFWEKQRNQKKENKDEATEIHYIRTNAKSKKTNISPFKARMHKAIS
jgi:hypothetical protein